MQQIYILKQLPLKSAIFKEARNKNLWTMWSYLYESLQKVEP